MQQVGFKVVADASNLDALPGKVKGVMDGVEGAIQLNVAGKMLGAIGSIFQETVGAAQGIETLTLAFEGLTGSSQAAAGVMSSLMAFAEKTPFKMEDLAGAAKQILIAGVAVEDLEHELSILGNLAAVTGTSVLSISNIYQKIGSTGKVGAETMNELARAGVPIFKALAEVMNVSQNEVAALVTKGAIGFPQIQAALAAVAGEGRLFGAMMDKMSRTGAGLVSTLEDNWFALKVAMGEPLNDVFKPVLRGAISGLSVMGNILKSIAPWMASIFSFTVGASLVLGVKMAVGGFQKLKATILSLVGAGVDVARSVVAANTSIASSANAAAMAQGRVAKALVATKAVGAASFSGWKDRERLTRSGTTQLPDFVGVRSSRVAMTQGAMRSQGDSGASFSGWSDRKGVAGGSFFVGGQARGAASMPAASVEIVPDKAIQGVGLLGKVGGVASKAVGGLKWAIKGLMGAFGPVGLVIMGVTEAISGFLSVAARHDEVDEQIASMEKLAEAGEKMVKSTRGGKADGVSSMDELEKRQGEAEKAMYAARDYEMSIGREGFWDHTAGMLNMLGNGIVGNGFHDSWYDETVKSAMKNSDMLEAVYDDLWKVTEGDVKRCAQAKRAAEQEAVAQAELAAKIKEKAAALKSVEVAYGKSEVSLGEAGGPDDMGLEKLARLEEEKKELLGGQSKTELLVEVKKAKGLKTDEGDAKANDLYVQLTRANELEGEITKEKRAQQDALEEINATNKLNADTLAAELDYGAEALEKVQDKAAAEEMALKFRQAGLSVAEAEAKSVAVVGDLRAKQRAKEEKAKRKEEFDAHQKSRRALAEAEVDLSFKESAQQMGATDAAVGIAQRVQGLMKEYKDAGIKPAQALGMAMREAGSEVAAQWQKAMLGGAKRSLTAIGGGGRYEMPKEMKIKGMEKQLRELVRANNNLRELIGLGGL